LARYKGVNGNREEEKEGQLQEETLRLEITVEVRGIK
jgi:hypothetical protein